MSTLKQCKEILIVLHAFKDAFVTLTVRHFYLTLPGLKSDEDISVATLTVTARGQVTFKNDGLQHLGFKPGDQIDFDKLPRGELRIRLARPAGNIKGFVSLFAGSTNEILSIDEMHEIAAADRAGEE